jgi:hypothetical protein
MENREGHFAGQAGGTPLPVASMGFGEGMRGPSSLERAASARHRGSKVVEGARSFPDLKREWLRYRLCLGGHLGL